MRNRIHRSLPAVSLLVILPTFVVAADSPSPTTPPPRLAVVISIDQCRADYLERFRPYFGPDGFRRLLEAGAHFENCHYHHAVTKTAVGHATILSGAYPATHGIVANDWLDRSRWLMINAVEDTDSPLVGAAPRPSRPPGSVMEARAGRSPRNFLATTVGDQLKLRLGQGARVFGVSNKDRSAILLGGKNADGAFWLGDENLFISSRYYVAEKLPPWVEEFNAQHSAEKYFGQTWDHLLDPAIYESVQGADDAEGEYQALGLGRTFPRRLDGGRAEVSNDFHNAFDHSPFASEIVAEFAREIITREQLGADATTDLLGIGFSQLDTIGHNYGPDSHEVMDSFLRLDRVMAGLLGFLDQRVGAGNYVVVITADHGIPPLPERVASNGGGHIPHGRVNLQDLDRAVTNALNATFGEPPAELLWFSRDNAGYHFRPPTLAAMNVTTPQAAEVAQAALQRIPWVACAYTAAEILAAPLDGTSRISKFRRSYFPGRGQDVLFELELYMSDRRSVGVNHGSSYAYDTHVPLVWYGPGVPQMRVSEEVGVEDIAPTLAALLRVPVPPQANGRRLF